jgi:hypothetical protein
VYVTGQSFGDNRFACLTIKYDRNGHKLWEQRYDGGGNAGGRGIAIDTQGNLCVVGFVNSGRNDDCLVIKYNPEGQILWEKKQSMGDKDSFARRVAIDLRDNIYMTGSSAYETWIIISYDPEGKERWRTLRSGYGGGVAMDSGDGVYITGNNNQVVKYDSNGKLLWERTISFPFKTGNSSVDGVMVVQSYVYVMGRVWSFVSQDSDGYLVKYNKNGDNIWQISYDSHKNDRFLAITINNKGETCVAGCHGYYDLIKYDANGKLLWEKKLPPHVINKTVASDSEGNIYIGATDTVMKIVNQ